MMTSGFCPMSPVAGKMPLMARNGSVNTLLAKPSGPVTIVPGPVLPTGAAATTTGASVAATVRRTVSGRRLVSAERTVRTGRWRYRLRLGATPLDPVV